jgi:hypothetical protein
MRHIPEPFGTSKELTLVSCVQLNFCELDKMRVDAGEQEED